MVKRTCYESSATLGVVEHVGAHSFGSLWTPFQPTQTAEGSNRIAARFSRPSFAGVPHCPPYPPSMRMFTIWTSPHLTSKVTRFGLLPRGS